MRTFQCLLALCFAFLWTAPAVAAEPAQASRYDFVAHPCASEDPLPGAICGFVAVPENYAKPSGRTIELNVVLFRATELPAGSTFLKLGFTGETQIGRVEITRLPDNP